MQRQVYMKAEQIARLMIGGIRVSEIAQRMGMSYDGLLRITKTPEYQEIEDTVRRTILGKMDAQLNNRTSMRQQMADEMEDDAVPEAWRVVIDNLKHKRDLKAALEILDRDPQHQFSKGSSASQTSFAAQPHYTVDAKALAQAIQDADATHSVIERAEREHIKAADA